MKAAFITRTGPPDVITYGDLLMPKPNRGECLVQVRAVDVNPIDLYIRGGLTGDKLNFPYIIGRDLAGEVAEIGPGVKQFKPGERVWATGQGFGGRQGTFAEYVTVDEKFLHLTPDGVTDEDIVAVSLVGITAHLGLVRDANIKAEEVLFINGGSGGVGSCVIQIAKILGARVIATAGSPGKVETCRILGADLALNYKTDEVDKAIREFAPKGVNVWWDTTREPDLVRAVSLLAMRGRIVLMAGRDARPPFPVGPFYVKDCSLHGFAMFNASAREQRAAARDLYPWIAQRKLKAPIDRVMPLSEAAEAHRLQEASTLHKNGSLAGKIVLKP